VEHEVPTHELTKLYANSFESSVVSSKSASKGKYAESNSQLKKDEIGEFAIHTEMGFLHCRHFFMMGLLIFLEWIGKSRNSTVGSLEKVENMQEKAYRTQEVDDGQGSGRSAKDMKIDHAEVGFKNQLFNQKYLKSEWFLRWFFGCEAIF